MKTRIAIVALILAFASALFFLDGFFRFVTAPESGEGRIDSPTTDIVRNSTNDDEVSSGSLDSAELEAETTEPPGQTESNENSAAKNYDPLLQINVSKTDCQSRRFTEGGITGIRETCVTRLTFDHAYSDFTYEQLKAIAEFDQYASYVLGKKILQDSSWSERYGSSEGLDYLRNAVILSGNPQTYLEYLAESGISNRFLPQNEDDERIAFVGYIAGLKAGVIDDSRIPPWILKLESLETDHATLSEWRNSALIEANRLIEARRQITGLGFLFENENWQKL